ncbi:MAG TPA: DUF4105 domain-containing protein [Gemmatimonadales bacterium]|nr:DUF4105 domain-containing protein [Gemmatimonadales bacterium]
MKRDRRSVRPAASFSIALALLGLPGATPLSAQGTAPPVPGSELTIYVMTMGVGGEVWERFGHNAIVVEDHRFGTSTAYNYGMFSFRQENFILRFLQGRMEYWMAGYPTEEDVPRYIAAQRSVWEQELNLMPEQRLELRRALEFNALPENRFYRYDYYRDNCSTRVRDAIDRVLDGRFHDQMRGPSPVTYRFHTQRLNTQSVPLYMGLLLALGHGVDAPITKWDEMFLPLKLRDYLREVRVPGQDGALVPLVKSERTLYASDAYPVPDAPPPWGPRFFLAGLVVGGALAWGGIAGRRAAAARWLLLVVGTFWALLTGLAGFVLAGLWAFTDHVMASRNENILQVSLFALALGLALPFALLDRPRALRGAKGLAIAVGGLSLAGLLIKVLPLFDQVNGQVLAFFVPVNLGLTLGVLGWVRTRPLP